MWVLLLSCLFSLNEALKAPPPLLDSLQATITSLEAAISEANDGKATARNGFQTLSQMKWDTPTGNDLEDFLEWDKDVDDKETSLANLRALKSDLELNLMRSDANRDVCNAATAVLADPTVVQQGKQLSTVVAYELGLWSAPNAEVMAVNLLAAREVGQWHDVLTQANAALNISNAWLAGISQAYCSGVEDRTQAVASIDSAKSGIDTIRQQLADLQVSRDVLLYRMQMEASQVWRTQGDALKDLNEQFLQQSRVTVEHSLARVEMLLLAQSDQQLVNQLL